MNNSYNKNKYEKDLPINICINNVDKLKMYWHGKLEILLVLEGSARFRNGIDEYILEEDDLILVNSNTIYSLEKNSEKTIILGVQIDSKHYEKYYSKLSKSIFTCNSFDNKKEKQEKFDFIRRSLAKIVWKLREEENESHLIVGSEIHLLLDYLVENFKSGYIENGQASNIDKNIKRIKNILAYIDENIDKKISLQDLADREELNLYYLSYFIKKSLGISFQEYINIKRLERAVELLETSEDKITDIAKKTGFSSTKSLNRLIKKEYKSTATEYREKHKKYKKEENKSKEDIYLGLDKNAALGKLYKYL